MLTQLSRLGEMLKIPFEKARISQKTHFYREGSALAGTITGGAAEVVTAIDVESGESAEQISHLVRMAEASCYTLQSLISPVQVTATATLNGQPLELAVEA